MLKRIKENDLMQYINLHKNESGNYHGSGWCLAQFDQDNKLISTHYLLNDYKLKSEDDDELKTATQSAINFCKNKQNLWLGMMSCHQFTQPEPFKPEYAPHVARLARLIGEALSEE